MISEDLHKIWYEVAQEYNGVYDAPLDEFSMTATIKYENSNGKSVLNLTDLMGSGIHDKSVILTSIKTRLLFDTKIKFELEKITFWNYILSIFNYGNEIKSMSSDGKTYWLKSNDKNVNFIFSQGEVCESLSTFSGIYISLNNNLLNMTYPKLIQNTEELKRYINANNLLVSSIKF